MNTARVIRCEHPNGQRANRGFEDLDEYPWEDLPCPNDDGIYTDDWIGAGWVCGAHEHTLDSWFPPGIRATFRNMGYRFVVLDVPIKSTHMGRMQAVFDRKAAVEVGEYLQ